jgi:hypothetical protein
MENIKYVENNSTLLCSQSNPAKAAPMPARPVEIEDFQKAFEISGLAAC